MLIQKLNQIKEAIQYRSLYLTERVESASFIARLNYMGRLTDLCRAEKQISLLQAGLSNICSDAASLVHYWPHQGEEFITEITSSIRKRLDALKLGETVIKLLSQKPTLKDMDPWIYQDTNKTGTTKAGIHALKKVLPKYAGSISEQWPEIDALEIIQSLELIRGQRLDGQGALDVLVERIGRTEDHEFRQSQSDRILNKRFN